MVEWKHKISEAIRAAGLGWAVVDDAILIPNALGNDPVCATVLGTYDSSLDVLSKQAYNSSVHIQRWPRWSDHYLPSAAAYLGQALEDYSKRATARTDGCKVGFAKFDSTASSPLTIRPINHLVTEHFNRRLAVDRMAEQHEANLIWTESLKGFMRGPQIFEMPCPSQGFLELSVMTADGNVVIARKLAMNSVYARRNGGFGLGVTGSPSPSTAAST